MAKLTTTAGTTKLELSYTAPSQKMLDLVSDALNYLYPNGYTKEGEDESTLISDLTNQEKANIIEAVCKEYITNCAKSYHVNKQVENTRATATTDTNTRYE